jgi:hypothetical protein
MTSLGIEGAVGTPAPLEGGRMVQLALGLTRLRIVEDRLGPLAPQLHGPGQVGDVQ